MDICNKTGNKTLFEKLNDEMELIVEEYRKIHLGAQEQLDSQKDESSSLSS